jgi:antitoxin ParD1/3/4
LARHFGEASVPTRKINLTAEQDAFVERVVRSGEYQNASEAVRDALRLLQQRRREDALKLKAFACADQSRRGRARAGRFRRNRGRDLDSYLDRLPAALSDRAR